MSTLDDSNLVAAETPLMDFIRSEALYRLVLQGSKIEGIVTRSDLFKLPVRLLAFSLVTHAEMLVGRVIRTAGLEEKAILDALPKRSKSISRQLEKLKEQKRNPDLLELTYLPEKHAIVEKFSLLDTKYLNELGEIIELRNTVAHAKNYAKNEDLIQEFMIRLRLAQQWIESFQERYRERTG